MKEKFLTTECAEDAEGYRFFSAISAHSVVKFLVFFILVFFAPLSFSVVHADVKTVSGNINFDVGSDSTYEMKLTSDGLQVGAESTRKLEIGGNLISDNLYVGQTGGNSTLSIQGTMGFGLETVSANTTLSGNTVILADSSSANIILTLPDAQTVSGRIYKIKKTVQTGYVKVKGGGNIDGDSNYYMYDSPTATPYLEVLASSDNIWNVMSKTDGVTPVVRWKNLQLWLKFDETSGTTATDSSQNSNHGTLSGFDFSTGTTSGNVGNALTFDGSNDVIEVSADSTIDTADAITISMWIKDLNDGQTYHTIRKDDGSSPNRVWIIRRHTDTVVNWHIWDEEDDLNQHTPANSWEINSWFHLVCMGELIGGTIYSTIYKNGVFVSSQSFSGSEINVDSNEPIKLGKTATQSQYKNQILDDVRIYNRRLTDEEIWDLYQLGQ